MINEKQIYCVRFNPKINGFDIDSLYTIINDNWKTIQLNRNNKEGNEKWSLVFVANTLEECEIFIEKYGTVLKSGKSTLEEYLDKRNSTID